MKPTSRLLMTLALFVATHRAAAQVPFQLASSPNMGSSVNSITTADVNNDGKPDLISASYMVNRLTVFTNSGNGFFAANASYTVGSFPHQVIAADVNNDGWPDLITANETGNSLTVLTNDGNGRFALAATLNLFAGSFPWSVAAADVNGDGTLDLISANFGNNSFTIWTNSGGIFVSNATYPVGSPPVLVIAADVNGDGYADLIVALEAANKLSVFTNDGSGGFMLASSPGISPGPAWVAAADVNGDGRVDLISVGGDKVVVLTNAGSGLFVSNATYTVGSDSVAVVAADVNGDGKPDVIAVNRSSSTLSVLTNNGTGAFGSNTTLNASSEPNALAVADINGDGRVDLISGNSGVGTLVVWTNASTFLPRLTLKRSGTNVIVSWPAIWANWTLRQNDSLDPYGWTSFGGVIGNDGTTKRATNSPPGTSRFFRLSNP